MLILENLPANVFSSMEMWQSPSKEEDLYTFRQFRESIDKYSRKCSWHAQVNK